MNDYPRGERHLCFDASPLIHYNDADRLSDLAAWFGVDTCFVPRVVRDIELRRGLKNHPNNADIINAPWLTAADVLDDDFEFIVDLRQLWGSPGDRDYGEAEVVALCRRYGWVAVMNDQRGRAAARRFGVSCVSTAGLLVGATAEGCLSEDAAWELHKLVEGGFTKPMILPTADEYRSALARAVAAVKRWTDQNHEVLWPATLGMRPAIDDLLRRAVEATKV